MAPVSPRPRQHPTRTHSASRRAPSTAALTPSVSGPRCCRSSCPCAEVTSSAAHGGCVHARGVFVHIGSREPDRVEYARQALLPHGSRPHAHARAGCGRRPCNRGLLARDPGLAGGSRATLRPDRGPREARRRTRRQTYRSSSRRRGKHIERHACRSRDQLATRRAQMRHGNCGEHAVDACSPGTTATSTDTSHVSRVRDPVRHIPPRSGDGGTARGYAPVATLAGRHARKLNAYRPLRPGTLPLRVDLVSARH